MAVDSVQQTVDIIASGYEWECPICTTLNKEIEYMELVTCSKENCKRSYQTNLPEHCYG